MAGLAIISFLVGAVYGLRFKVVVLLPLTLALSLLSLPFVLIAQLGLLEGLTSFALAAFALQGGYVFGSIAAMFAFGAQRIFARPLNHLYFSVVVEASREGGSCWRSSIIGRPIKVRMQQPLLARQPLQIGLGADRGVHQPVHLAELSQALRRQLQSSP